MNEAAQGKLIQLKDVDLYCEERGEGEPVLLLHGMAGCAGDWAYAGRQLLEKEYRLVVPDARGHGRSTNPAKTFSHRQHAMDTLALLDALGIDQCKAIGMSMGGNTLLHLTSMQPGRVEAMVVVSATMSFPEQARAIMRSVSPDAQPESEWEAMRGRHSLGDEQIRLLWKHQRDLGESTDDMCFTPYDLARIEARTLVVHGDRDPLYPVEMGVEMYKAIPRSALWVVPGGGHGPIFVERASLFARTALDFLRADAG